MVPPPEPALPATGSRPGAARAPGAELLALTAELVAVPSVSHHEERLASLVADRLRATGHLEVERIGDSVVARTCLGRPRRLLLGGHLDTVPPPAPAPRGAPVAVDGGAVHGVGAVDMKGGLAVLLDLATTVTHPAVDVTFVLYACEEVTRADNALGRLVAERPDLVVADAAVLCEPTAGSVEAGCQGTARARLVLGGQRAHTARPWRGINAVHRLAGPLGVLAGYTPRVVTIDGCTYTEQLQAVGVDGGVSGNVVPDRAELTVNYRFAPDRDETDAEAALHRLFDPVLDVGAGDAMHVVDMARGAPPALGQPLLARLVAVTGRPPAAKVGWTDVATLAAAGVPATNFGPGDPELAHTADEVVTGAELAEAHRVLTALLIGPY